MEVLSLQVFVSLMLALGSVLLFAFSCRQRDFDHADRLALLPMDDDGGQPPRKDESHVKQRETTHHG